jgi:hypothetical protein
MIYPKIYGNIYLIVVDENEENNDKTTIYERFANHL